MYVLGLYTQAEVTKYNVSRRRLKSRAEEGYSPVCKALCPLITFQSSAGHVKPDAKMGGPPSKAKYSPVTDSEQVP